MKHIRMLVLILCACFVSVAWGERPQACTAYTPWAQFHRANMQRYNPCEKVLNVHNVGKLQLKWSYPTGGTSSSPVVEQGVVYTGSGGGTLYALKASNGALLWSYQTAASPGNVASPAIANGVVYYGSADGLVYALNASTGTKLWSYQTAAQV